MHKRVMTKKHMCSFYLVLWSATGVVISVSVAYQEVQTPRDKLADWLYRMVGLECGTLDESARMPNIVLAM